jgi:hypothetical protein
VDRSLPAWPRRAALSQRNSIAQALLLRRADHGGDTAEELIEKRRPSERFGGALGEIPETEYLSLDRLLSDSVSIVEPTDEERTVVPDIREIRARISRPL